MHIFLTILVCFFYTFGIDYSFTVRCVVSPKYVSVVLMMYARSKHIFSGSTMLHTILNKDWYLNTLWGETGIRMGFMLWKLIFHPPKKSIYYELCGAKLRYNRLSFSSSLCNRYNRKSTWKYCRDPSSISKNRVVIILGGFICCSEGSYTTWRHSNCIDLRPIHTSH